MYNKKAPTIKLRLIYAWVFARVIL